MATEVKLPRLGRTMEQGTIVILLVKIGDEVKKGDAVFEVETDKATLQIESPAEGFVKHILAETGQDLSVGHTVLILGGKDEVVGDDFARSIISKNKTVRPKTAGELQRDVSAAVAMPQARLGATVLLNARQRITAEKMARSKREIPSFYLSVRTDVTKLVESREKLNKAGKLKVSYNDFIMRAAAIGLEKFPVMTGRLDGDSILLADSVDIGLAISIQDCLVAPVVRNVSKKSVLQIADDSRVLVEKARVNKLSPADLEGGCMTVSNLGAFGVESFIPIIIPGQCSILGVGQISDVYLPDENDNLTIRKMMTMTLSVDHKITNGAYAAQFIDFVKKLLEDPCSL